MKYIPSRCTKGSCKKGTAAANSPGEEQAKIKQSAACATEHPTKLGLWRWQAGRHKACLSVTPTRNKCARGTAKEERKKEDWHVLREGPLATVACKPRKTFEYRFSHTNKR